MPRDLPLSDDQRFPLIPDDRRQLLRDLRQHPRAPIWNMACGDRLDRPTLEALEAWKQRMDAGLPRWRRGELPAWLAALSSRVRVRVPWYRQRAADADFFAIPTLRRADLSAAPWAFVPDDHPLDDLLVFPTSGSTGAPFEVYSHPFAANATLPFLQVALAQVGVALEGGPGRVALASVHAQLGTYTYPSLMRWLGGAGYVKINLHPGQWRDPGDRAAFLDDLAPEVYLGDPYAFAALLELPLRSRPKALISSATALTAGWRATLEAHFGAPVLDVYSLTEARLLAVDWGEGHTVLAPDVYVEVLEPLRDVPVPPGERGEIVVSAGNNPALPILRYRTGDFARLEHRADRVVLRDLEGRPPVCLLDASGAVVNTVDVSRALAPLAIVRFQLHQTADRALRLSLEGAARPGQAIAALRGLFGDLPLEIRALSDADPGRKPLTYSSEVAPPRHPAVFRTAG